MHFSNYISRAAAEAVTTGEVTVTPTALKQTPKATIRFLKERGVKIRVVESRGRPRKLDEEQIKRILAMKRADVSFYRIARLTGVPKSTAFDYFRRYGDNGLDEDEVEAFQLREARRLFRRILGHAPEGEVAALARRGCRCTDLHEVEYIVREIDEIIREGT
ncbi:MAG: hypothetical protein GXO65_04440 [Euryarchaeota archaeon]|nr:hypothetical protein [Euryarchaeota archaeon]